MPGRKTVLVNHEIYHIFNRGVALQPTFLNHANYSRAIAALLYYQHLNPPIKFSKFTQKSSSDQQEILVSLAQQNRTHADLITFCFMPNHFHLLLKQNLDNGISKYLSQFTNSYTKYFNTKNNRSGHLFQGNFKAARIESNEQLLHVSRYIHLNPFSGCLVKNIKALNTYRYSSLPEYLNPTQSKNFQKNIIIDQFSTPEKFENFIFNQADYQKQLQLIKHLTLD